MARSLSVVALLAIFIIALLPAPSAAWSIDGHQLITKHATEKLPPIWRNFFNYYSWFLTDAVAYPDTYYRGSDPNEGPRHYIDLEVWSPSDPSTGTLPQAIEEFTHEMQSAIEAKDWTSVLLFAGRVAHYIEDVAQPYHTTLNYDPTNKNGVGLHAVLDSSLMVHLSEVHIQTSSTLGAISPIQNLTSFVLGMAIQSHSFLAVINQTLIDEGLDWSPELTRIVENRTNTAITAVARVWYTAIVAAKSPPPAIPAKNQLSITVETVSLTDNNLTSIRLRVVDSLGVGTYANVTLRTSESIFRGQVANVVPQAGEYVVLSETGLHPNDMLTAQRAGYDTATLVVNTATNNGIVFSKQETSTVPYVTIVALAVMLVGILVLVTLDRRTAKDS